MLLIYLLLAVIISHQFVSTTDHIMHGPYLVMATTTLWGLLVCFDRLVDAWLLCNYNPEETEYLELLPNYASAASHYPKEPS